MERRFRRRVDPYYQQLKSGAAFMDFGCGAGEFLNRMRARGCATIGMDFSEHSLAVARGNGHVAFPANDSGWACVPEATMQFVRMNHVLEHLYAPADVLQRLRDRMAPGAVIHIAVPNPDGLSARRYGRHWHGLDCPRHVIFYPKTVLAQWLEALGFRVLEILSEPVAKDLIRSRALAAHYNRGEDWGELDRLASREELRGKAALPVLFAQLFGLADRIHVIAVRAAS